MKQQFTSCAYTVSELKKLISQTPFDEMPEIIEACEEDVRISVQKLLASARSHYEHELKERSRVLSMYEFDRTYAQNGYVIGLDEVGRGPLAGPLTVCAVVLPSDPVIWGLNDSKQLTGAVRRELSKKISEFCLYKKLVHIAPDVIDTHGMAYALRRAMSEAIKDCELDYTRVLIDGNPLHIHKKEINIIKGDTKSACIAAASIVAKVARDALMVSYDSVYPAYDLAHCKGYGSKRHIEAIQKFGLTPIHRKSFCGNFLENPRLF